MSREPSPARRHRAPGPDPMLVFGVSLFASLALWLPSLRPTLAGDLDIVVSGLRYLAALGVSWFGIATLGRLWARYEARAAAAPTRAATPDAPPDPTVPQRRRDDPGNAAASGPAADSTAAE